jgi:hypothetical protein
MLTPYFPKPEILENKAAQNHLLHYIESVTDYNIAQSRIISKCATADDNTKGTCLSPLVLCCGHNSFFGDAKQMMMLRVNTGVHVDWSIFLQSKLIYTESSIALRKATILPTRVLY